MPLTELINGMVSVEHDWTNLSPLALTRSILSFRGKETVANYPLIGLLFLEHMDDTTVRLILDYDII